MKKIFIGVDGGATKSKVRIETEQGELLGQVTAGAANIRISVDATWQAIYHAIEEILKSANISLHDKQYHFHASMGLAGCEVKEAYDDFILRAHPFATLQVTSDAHIACIGAHAGYDGAIIIVGTGVVGYEIVAEKTYKVGGWGFPNDDQGGGAWLGLEAIRLAFQWLDHRVEKCPLAEDIFAFFNQDIDAMTAWANRANSTAFAKLAPIVINHAQQQEAQAVRLLKKSAQFIDRIAMALEKQIQHVMLPCALIGGIAPFIEPWLSEELRERLVTRKADPSVGAILMMREQVAVA